jgi:TRAP-type C4-dicarboxylate transport system substrate-binding protein
LVEAAKLKLLPDELLGVVAQMRLVGASHQHMTVGEIYSALKEGAQP